MLKLNIQNCSLYAGAPGALLTIHEKFTSFCLILKETHTEENWFLFSASRCIHSRHASPSCRHILVNISSHSIANRGQYSPCICRVYAGRHLLFNVKTIRLSSRRRQKRSVNEAIEISRSLINLQTDLRGRVITI